MKKSSIQVNIPNPCPKKWSKMIPVDQGAFCKSCERIVIDFTAMSDQELIDYFQNYTGNLCGRFKKGQIKRTIKPLPSPSFSRNYAASGLLAAGLLLGGTVEAQEPFKIGEVEIEQQIGQSNNKGISNKNNTEEITPIQIEISIKGKVIEEETGETLPFAKVSLIDKKGKEIVSTESDLDGNYTINIPEKFENKTITLLVNYVGLDSTSIEIDLKKYEGINIDIHMKSSVLIGEFIVVKRGPINRVWYFFKNRISRTVRDIKLNKQIKKQEKQSIKAIKAFENNTLVEVTEEPKIVQSISPNPAKANTYLHFTFSTIETKEIDIMLVRANAEGLNIRHHQIRQNGNKNFRFGLNGPKVLTPGTYYIQILINDTIQEIYPIEIIK